MTRGVLFPVTHRSHFTPCWSSGDAHWATNISVNGFNRMNMMEGPAEPPDKKKHIRLGATCRRCLMSTTADRQRIVKETPFMFI